MDASWKWTSSVAQQLKQNHEILVYIKKTLNLQQEEFHYTLLGPTWIPSYGTII